AAVLVAALVPILIGLTNKQRGDWGDPLVGGLIAIGLVISAVFVFIELRESDPIVPVRLFTNRSFTISVIAMFLASMAFFVPVVVLDAVSPRQVGAAASSLTLFRQIGGAVGLAISGTIFATRLVEELPRGLGRTSLPPQVVAGFSSSGGSVLGQLTGTGDLG